MNALKETSLVVRIAIGVVALIIIAVVAKLLFFSAAPEVPVISTQNVELYQTAGKVLTAQHVAYSESNDAKGNFTLSVAADKANDASKFLAQSGIKDLTGLAKGTVCPAPPGFTGTRAANVRADNCADEHSVQTMLLAAGALAANVKVSQQESDNFLGADTVKNVVAQVFMTDRMRTTWNPASAARSIALAVGTSTDRVSITDSELRMLYDGSTASADAGRGGASADAAGSTSTASLGCGDIENATEIETKRAAVSSCYESRISSKLTQVLGGSDRYTIAVNPTIASKSSTTNSTRMLQGPRSDYSRQSGDGTVSEDSTNPPGQVNTTTVSPAGAVTALAISVTLNSKVVTPEQRQAVVSMLSTFTADYPGSPVPSVKMTPFTNGAGLPNSNGRDVQKLRTAANEPNTSGADVAAPGTSMPKWALAALAIMAVALIATVLILLRRSAAMQQERERLNEAFRHEQRQFENFAQQNPDDLAAEMNDLFNRPSTPHPMPHG